MDAKPMCERVHKPKRKIQQCASCEFLSHELLSYATPWLSMAHCLIHRSPTPSSKPTLLRRLGVPICGVPPQIFRLWPAGARANAKSSVAMSLPFWGAWKTASPFLKPFWE